MEQLKVILSTLQNKPATDPTPNPSVDARTPSHPMEEYVDVFPDGYDYYVDEDPCTPVDATIISIADSQSQGESTIGMSPYEMLYERKCQSSIHWDEAVERRYIGPEVVQRTSEAMQNI
uniref:Uncharacterized protein n=1 Tax=Cannabis sativa TaxID=3483 RepID=A0A803Q0K6_CANSA